MLILVLELDENEHYYHDLEIKNDYIAMIYSSCICNENKHYIWRTLTTNTKTIKSKTDFLNKNYLNIILNTSNNSFKLSKYVDALYTYALNSSFFFYGLH
jgi:hypothetical protein